MTNQRSAFYSVIIFLLWFILCWEVGRCPGSKQQHLACQSVKASVRCEAAGGAVGSKTHTVYYSVIHINIWLNLLIILFASECLQTSTKSAWKCVYVLRPGAVSVLHLLCEPSLFLSAQKKKASLRLFVLSLASLPLLFHPFSVLFFPFCLCFIISRLSPVSFFIKLWRKLK